MPKIVMTSTAEILDQLQEDTTTEIKNTLVSFWEQALKIEGQGKVTFEIIETSEVNDRAQIQIELYCGQSELSDLSQAEQGFLTGEGSMIVRLITAGTFSVVTTLNTLA